MEETTLTPLYQQLWHQLKLVEGIVCREYTPGPTEDQKVVPIYPATLRQEVLRRNHDAPSAGHLGPEKTLQRLRQEAYWVNMARDVTHYCEQCVTCQRTRAA